MTVRRTFWILSIANWLLAVAVWSVSAYLGIARPTSLFIPTTLFVIGIFAVVAGTLCWVVARFEKHYLAVFSSGCASVRGGCGCQRWFWFTESGSTAWR